MSATAIIFNVSAPHDLDPNISIDYLVTYIGSSVPGTFIEMPLTTTVAKTSLASLVTTIASDVRNQAIVLGFTIPSNQVFMPSYSAQ